MYTVKLPMGGRKTLISGRVMSSGYIPPVSSNSARRNSVSELQIPQHQYTAQKQQENRALTSQTSPPHPARTKSDPPPPYSH